MMFKKKKILFTYPSMNIGGSTTCLLSILNGLDYNKYDVDILFNSNTGEIFDMIPKQVNILSPALKYQDKKQEYIHRILSPRYMFHFFVSKLINKKTGHWIQGTQYLEMKDVEFYRKIEDEYDVAIAAQEGDRCKFVARHITAKRKLAWIHVNYIDAFFDAKYDKSTMKEFDRIVLVSDVCKKAFDKCFKELSEKTIVIENILSKEYVKTRSQATVEIIIDKTKINLITVCRITFASKGLDRAVAVLSRLKKEGKLENFCWYIIGDGAELTILRDLISSYGLDENVLLLGNKKNPYPYLKDMTMFFLPSRFEGKPMVVTEAFIMGLPALVTEYSSAREQVRDGVDGIIVENSKQGINDGLLRIIEHPEIIEELKKNVIATDYSNVEEMKKVEALIDGEI